MTPGCSLRIGRHQFLSLLLVLHHLLQRVGVRDLLHLRVLALAFSLPCLGLTSLLPCSLHKHEPCVNLSYKIMQDRQSITVS